MKPTVLFFESGVHGGGSFTSLFKHIQCIQQVGITPIVVFFNETYHIKELKKAGVAVYLINDPVYTAKDGRGIKILNKAYMKGWLTSFRNLLFSIFHKATLKGLAEIASSHNVSHVHCNTELFRDRVGVMLADTLKLPLIVHLRSKYEIGRISFDRKYVNFVNKRTTKFLCVSKDTASFWIEKVGIDAQKVEVLYDYYMPEPATEISDSSQEPETILCVASLIEVKNQLFLMNALAPLLEHRKNAELHLVGGGEPSYIAQVRQAVHDLGITSQVKFLGFQENVAERMQKAAVLVLTSLREGLPNVLIEASGSGLPVVATDVGGVSEIIEHNVNGFLVERDNAEMFLKYVNEALDLSHEKKRLMVQNGKKIVEGRFSKQNYLKAIQHVYE